MTFIGAIGAILRWCFSFVPRMLLLCCNASSRLVWAVIVGREGSLHESHAARGEHRHRHHHAAHGEHGARGREEVPGILFMNEGCSLIVIEPRCILRADKIMEENVIVFFIIIFL